MVGHIEKFMVGMEEIMVRENSTQLALFRLNWGIGGDKYEKLAFKRFKELEYVKKDLLMWIIRLNM